MFCLLGLGQFGLTILVLFCIFVLSPIYFVPAYIRLFLKGIWVMLLSISCSVSADNLLVNSDFSEGPATPSKAGFDSAETFDVPHWKNAPGGSYGTAARSNGINQRNGKWFAFFRKSCAGAEQLTAHRLGTNETLQFSFAFQPANRPASGKQVLLAEVFYDDNGTPKSMLSGTFDTDAGGGGWIHDKSLQVDAEKFPDAVGKIIGVRIGINPKSSIPDSAFIRVSDLYLGPTQNMQAQPEKAAEPPESVLSEMKPKPHASKFPNIVLIYADDLGYGDLSCYGATKISTPNIDRLTKEGRLFTDAHSTSAVCTPSRYALLTGEYPFRINNYGPVFCENPLIIDTNKTTLASLLKRKGYATACIGKWHLGFGSERKPDWNRDLKPGPLEVGFDYFYGIPVVNSHPPFVYVENHRVVGLNPADPLIYRRGGKTHGKPYPEKHSAPPKHMPSVIGGKAAHDFYVDEKSAEHLTTKALRWMNIQKQPFFLYYASHNIHHPFTPHPYFHGKSECGLYGDFVEELDWSVGEILAALDKFGVADNTLVIFTSDNGGMFNRGGKEAIRQGHSLNGELKGQKFGAWEGGHRVPFIAKWPTKIPAGTTSGELIANMDLLPTFAAISEQKLAAEEARDGTNQLPLFLVNDAKSAREELILMPHKSHHTSLRQGDWVYIPGVGDGGWMKGEKGDLSRQLYNLKEDLEQKNNLINEYPEKAEAMQRALQEILDTAVPNPEVLKNTG